MPPRLSIAALALALAAVAFSAGIRTESALDDPNFTADHPEGLLKSDPGLLYYLTQRILEAGGRPPADFRADPRIQYPDLTDVPAEFTVGQEFLLAWAYRLLAPDEPLHTFAVRLFAWIASLAALGVAGIVWWRTKSPAWTALAAAAFVVIPANYRTIGFILIREDLSFPLFALHLALLARAERRRTPRAFLLAGLPLALALATWHAMGFFVALEAACLVLAFLVTGRSAFELRGAWAALVLPVLAATLVPALRANALLVGLPMQMAWALLVVAIVRSRAVERSRTLSRGRAVATFAVTWVALVALAQLFEPGRSGYAHVRDVLVAKVVHLGRRPADPTAIPFDARLLWQGPFETLPVEELASFLGGGTLLLLAAAVVVALRSRRARAGFEGWLLLVTLLALPTAWLFGRTVILAGACVPAVAAVTLARAERARLALGVFAVALAIQAFGFLQTRAEATAIPWYLPPGRQREIAELVHWIDEHVDPREPIVADFMNSTAILAHTGNPVALQPKYETEASRRKAQAFLETFFHGTPEDLRRLVRERFHARYLLVDRYTLGVLSPWTAGLADPRPAPGTAAEVFLGQDGEALASVPGFELVYRSPPSIRRIDGEPYDFFRLYLLP